MPKPGWTRTLNVPNLRRLVLVLRAAGVDGVSVNVCGTPQSKLNEQILHATSHSFLHPNLPLPRILQLSLLDVSSFAANRT